MNTGRIVDPHSVEGEEKRRRENAILYGSVSYSNGTATVRPVEQVLTNHEEEENRRRSSRIKDQKKCNKCDLEVTDEGVWCWRCKKWMHYICVGATKEQIDLQFPIDYECPSHRQSKSLEKGGSKKMESGDGQTESKVDHDKHLGQKEGKDQDKVKASEDQITKNKEKKSIEIQQLKDQKKSQREEIDKQKEIIKELRETSKKYTKDVEDLKKSEKKLASELEEEQTRKEHLKHELKVLTLKSLEQDKSIEEKEKEIELLNNEKIKLKRREESLENHIKSTRALHQDQAQQKKDERDEKEVKIKELEARYDKDVENLRNALQKETDENIYLKGKLKEHEDTCKGKNKSMTMIKLNKNIQDFVSKPSKIEEMEKEIKDLKEREMELIKELDTSKSNNMILEIRRGVEIPTDIKEKEQQLQEEVKEKDKQIRTMKEEIKQYEKRLETYVADNLTKERQIGHLVEHLDNMKEINEELRVTMEREEKDDNKVKRKSKTKKGEIQKIRSENTNQVNHNENDTGQERESDSEVDLTITIEVL